MGGAVLTKAQVDIIKERLKKGERGIKIAKDFGITRATVSLISLGKIWRDTRMPSKEVAFLKKHLFYNRGRISLSYNSLEEAWQEMTHRELLDMMELRDIISCWDAFRFIRWCAIENIRFCNFTKDQEGIIYACLEGQTDKSLVYQALEIVTSSKVNQRSRRKLYALLAIGYAIMWVRDSIPGENTPSFIQPVVRCLIRIAKSSVGKELRKNAEEDVKKRQRAWILENVFPNWGAI